LPGDEVNRRLVNLGALFADNVRVNDDIFAKNVDHFLEIAIFKALNETEDVLLAYLVANFDEPALGEAVGVHDILLETLLGNVRKNDAKAAATKSADGQHARHQRPAGQTD
jgi:hypothetical protein